MAGYVLSSRVPYSAYLEEQSSIADHTAVPVATRRIVATIRDSTAELIASHEALRSQNIELLKTTKAGFQQLAWDVQQTAAAVRVLNATFTWGFNSVLAHTGRMADTLESLLATAKTPTKTRAYEHFDDGRRAFDRGHVPEALEQVDKAISGDHTSAGYKLEWRFHLLRGAILVGTFSHPDILDLPAAEQSYLSAAVYARPEDPNGAALALLGAGWACYCQARLDDALTHTNAATTLSPSLAEGHFQASKILMALGRWREGLRRLEIARGLDPVYVVKAAADGDFQNFSREFDAWCTDEGDKSRAALNTLYATWSSRVAFWVACVSAGVNLPLVGSIVRASSPPLLDTLICLHALDPVTRDLKFESNWSALEAAQAIEAIPATVDIPIGLLHSLRDQMDRWPLDAEYFALNGVLLKRGYASTVVSLCARAHEREAKPLELFAVWLAAATERGPVEERLSGHLQQVPAARREVVIADFELLRGTATYAPETIGAIRTSLTKRYDEWTDEIAVDVRHRANRGTPPPLEGAAARAIVSMLAMAIASLAVQWALGSTSISVAVWMTGVALAVGKPIAHRMTLRKRRLRTRLSAEAKLRRRLVSDEVAPTFPPDRGPGDFALEPPRIIDAP